MVRIIRWLFWSLCTVSTAQKDLVFCGGRLKISCDLQGANRYRQKVNAALIERRYCPHFSCPPKAICRLSSENELAICNYLRHGAMTESSIVEIGERNATASLPADKGLLYIQVPTKTSIKSTSHR